MASPLLRLVAFIAVLLMPFAMAAAPAMAPAPAASGHCDEHGEPADAPASTGHCAACSALPTADSDRPVASARTAPLARLIAVAPFHGIEPDTITPPPKPS